MNSDKYFELRQKLVEYRFERSHERLQINLCIKQHREIRVTFCFPAEDWGFLSKEREFFEDLVEEYLSSDGWYLKPKHKLVSIEKPYFNHNTITRFTLRRHIYD